MKKQHNILLNDEPEALGGGASDGLSAALAKAAAEGGLAFGAEMSEETPPAKESDDTPPGKPAEEKDDPAPGSKATTKKDVAAAADAEGDEDEEFPEIGTSESKKEADEESDFDEKKFDEETEASSKDMPEVAKKKFKELRSELKQFRQASPAAATEVIPEAVQAELTQLREQAEELKGLRQAHNELLSQNDEQAVLHSKAYQDQVQKPVDEITATVKMIAEAADMEPQVLYDALLEKDVVKQDRLLDGLKGKLTDRSYARIVRFADDYKALEVKAGELMQNARDTINADRERERQELDRAKQARAGAYQSEVRSSFEAYASRVPGLVDSSGQLTETAKDLQAKSVAIDLDTLTEGDLGFMAFAAKAFPVLRKAYVNVMAENRALKAGKSSSKGSPVTTNQQADEEDHDNPQGLSDRMRGKEFTFDPANV